MSYDFLTNHPLLKNMSPEKINFLMNFANAPKPSSLNEMMPFLLSNLNHAKSQNISFSNPEKELLFTILKQNMNEEEAKKADNIIKLLKSKEYNKK